MINNIYRSFVKDNIWTLSGHILIYAKGIILLPILIKSLGIEIYSGYVLIMTALGFIFGISSFGIGYSAKRHLPVSTNDESRRQLFYSQFLLHLLSIVTFSLGILVLQSILQSWFVQENVEFTFLLIPIYLLFMLFFFQSVNFFRHTNRINYFNIGVVLMPYLNIAIIVVVIFFDLTEVTVNKLILFQIIALGLVAIPFSVKIIRELGLSFPTLKIKKIREDLRLGFPLVLSYVVDTILSVGDRYVIALFIAVTAVGYYNPAYTLGSLIIFFPKVSGIVLPPLLSRAVDTGHEIEARQVVNYTIKGFLLVAIPFVIGSYILGETLLALLANDEVASNASYIMPVVAIGTTFYGLNLIIGNILFVRKKTKAMFWTNSIAAITNLLLNLILLSIFKSIIIAAITTLVSYFIAFILLLRVVSADWEVDFQPLVLFKSLVASIMMGVVLLGLSSVFSIQRYEFVIVLLQILIGAIVYLAVIIGFGVISKREMAYLLKMSRLSQSN